MQFILKLAQAALCVGALLKVPLRRRFAMPVLLGLAVLPSFLVRVLVHTHALA